ncbi:MAG TPA: helix-turn-helix domain-containing protein [Spongiibacteraceae bacterium]|jgi:transcriptional regulator GlxA family with amidase domain|nr:helix-turn-helix domain-containing protein [Spongiibacteraceae bacterium]
MKVYILLVPNMFASSALGIMEVLSSADTFWNVVNGASVKPSNSVQLVSRTREAVACLNGITLRPDLTFEDAGDADIVIIPSLVVGYRGLENVDAATVDWIRQIDLKTTRIASLCSGAFLLAEAGLLNGKSATTHWALEKAFRNFYPEVHLEIDKTVVDNGETLCCGGGMAWQNLILHILHQKGADHALQVARTFLMQTHEFGQRPYAGLVAAFHTDGIISKVQDWMKANFADLNAVNTGIAMSGLPPRTFHRRFKSATGMTPTQYVQQLRIEESKLYLTETKIPVDEIGFKVGYEEPSFFRRLFKRSTGVSPRQFRQHFSINTTAMADSVS